VTPTPRATLALSMDRAKSLAKTIKFNWGIALDIEKAAPIWRSRLEAVGVTDDNAARICDGFLNHWRQARKPSLHDFVHYCAESLGYEEAPWRPMADRCHYCADTGRFPLVAPSHPERHHLAALPGFAPPAVWDQSPVYMTTVPCLCTAGQEFASEGLSETWGALRQQLKRWYDRPHEGPLMHEIHAYMRRCWTAYRKAADAAKAAALRDARERLAAGAHTEVVDDVPEDEIPF